MSKTYKFGPINRPYQTVINTKTPIELETLYHLSKRNAEGQSDYRTTQIYQESLGNSQYRYSYDKLGNITEIQQRENGTFVTKCTYEYDGLNQLVRENNVYTGKTKVYTYDNGGNILKETEYPYTTGTVGSAIKTIPYTYDDTNWKDKLISYNGQDAIGNPLSYRGNTLTWQNGRQLATLNGNGVIASYKYDANGLRTEKTVNGVKTVYYYVGDELVYEKRGANTELYYFYDESGVLSGIRYILNGQVSDCVVVTNWRGDVEALYDLNGVLVAQYIYDAWGSQISIRDGNGNEITNQSHIATVNPFRYRGYYLDTETNLYYLQSRYYDAETHRFICADGAIGSNQDLLGNNVYSYCSNNPVIMSDPTGCTKEDSEIMAKTVVFILVVMAFYQAYIDEFNQQPALNNENDLRNMMKDVLDNQYESMIGTFGTGSQVAYSALSALLSADDVLMSGLAIFSGVGAVFTLPFSIWDHVIDPYLTSGQRKALIIAELAGTGIVIGSCFVPGYGPLIGSGIGVVSGIGMSIAVSQIHKRNLKTFWGLLG